jgi:hypothetical protein
MVDPVPGANDEVTTLDAVIRANLNNPPPTNHFASGMIILDPKDNRRGPFSLPGFTYHIAKQPVSKDRAATPLPNHACAVVVIMWTIQR